jgi:agmatinase
VGSIVQVGIRSLRTRQTDVDDSRARGNDIVTVPEYRRRGVARILQQLPQGEPVYVSIDVDVLDMPLVPGCASAEVNGLSYEEVRDALTAIARHAEVVGARRPVHHGIPGPYRRAPGVSPPAQSRQGGLSAKKGTRRR